MRVAPAHSLFVHGLDERKRGFVAGIRRLADPVMTYVATGIVYAATVLLT
jgi:hypothetical protein